MADKNNLTELICRAYDIIGGLTPLENADCGKLCDRICCKGDGAGMLLFPGEENLFENAPGFCIEEIKYMDVPGMKLLLCDGECDRALRPLACRMFPAAPSVDDNGNAAVVPDIRGRRMCPLWDLKNAGRNFVASVGEAFVMLSRDKDMLNFMRLVSSEIEELKRFYRK